MPIGGFRAPGGSPPGDSDVDLDRPFSAPTWASVPTRGSHLDRPESPVSDGDTVDNGHRRPRRSGAENWSSALLIFALSRGGEALFPCLQISGRNHNTRKIGRSCSLLPEHHCCIDNGFDIRSSYTQSTCLHCSEAVDDFGEFLLNLATRRRSRGRRASLRCKLSTVEITMSSASSRNRIRASINSRCKYRVEKSVCKFSGIIVLRHAGPQSAIRHKLPVVLLVN